MTRAMTHNTCMKEKAGEEATLQEEAFKIQKQSSTTQQENTRYNCTKGKQCTVNILHL